MAMALVRSIGGLLKPPLTVRRTSRVTGLKRLERVLDSRLFGRRRDANVDLGPGTGRHDVGGGPPLDQTDIDRRSGGQVLQVLEPEDLVGQLHDRAAAVFGSHTGMGSLPLDLEAEPANSFSRRLQTTISESRLQHQDIGGLSRQVLDQSARVGTADLLVGGEQDPDGPRQREVVLS